MPGWPSTAQGVGMGSVRRALKAAGTAVSVAVLFTGLLSEVPASAAVEPGDALPMTAEAQAVRPRFAPGRFGPLRLGMTVREAVATGWAERIPRGESPCGEKVRMSLPYAEHAWLYAKRHGKGTPITIDQLAARYQDRTYAFGNGVRVGNPVRKLRRTYGDRFSIVRDRYESSYHWGRVRTPKGFLNFGFDTSVRPTARTRIDFMAVSIRPMWGLHSGC